MSVDAQVWLRPSVAAGPLLGAVLTGAAAQGICTCMAAWGRKLPSDQRAACFGHVLLHDVQDRFIAEQEAKNKRVHARFDGKLVELQKLWAASGAAVVPPPRPGVSKPAG